MPKRKANGLSHWQPLFQGNEKPKACSTSQRVEERPDDQSQYASLPGLLHELVMDIIEHLPFKDLMLSARWINRMCTSVATNRAGRLLLEVWLFKG